MTDSTTLANSSEPHDTLASGCDLALVVNSDGSVCNVLQSADDFGPVEAIDGGAFRAMSLYDFFGTDPNLNDDEHGSD